MPKIKRDYLIEKRNVLNEIRANNMTMQELRFFSIYLSKINKRDISTRVVRFSITDFKAIMELGRINIDYMKQVTNRLLCKVVNVPNEFGGYSGFQLFKECTVSVDSESNEWYVEIDAHDKALPLMFEFKSRYFTYQLWNALRLKGPNQLRMYEILKQYEKVGFRILSVEKLKELLGIEKKEYSRFTHFKERVLDACQEALAENTDIKFTYASHGKRGPGGKILLLKFTIEKNKDHADQLSLRNFIQLNEINEEPCDDEIIDDEIIEENDGDTVNPRFRERIEFLRETFNNEFTAKQVITLFDLAVEYIPELAKDELRCYHFFLRRYRYMEMRNEQEHISNRFAYIKSIITVEV